MKLKNIHLVIPNALTLLNLLLGCIGIVYAFDERYFIVKQVSESNSIYDTHEISSRLFTACILIFAAAIIDFFDGFVARALNAQSELGKQLDSLADMVTFGVLPGIIYYQLLERAFFLESGALYTSKIWLFPAFLIPLCTAIRLGRFNITESPKEFFRGLASPAQAIFAACLPLIYFTDKYNLSGLIINKWILFSLVLLMSYLMISNIKMYSLKLKSFSLNENKIIYFLIFISILSIVLMQYLGIAVAILLYILFSIFTLRNQETIEE